jgi:hypothetical protein
LGLSTIAKVAVIVLLLGFLANYLLEPDVRKRSTDMMFFAVEARLVFFSFKMLYAGEMATFNVQGGNVEILRETYPLKF